MHDIRFIRDNAEAFDRALKRRDLPGEAARLIALDETRRGENSCAGDRAGAPQRGVAGHRRGEKE